MKKLDDSRSTFTSTTDQASMVATCTTRSAGPLGTTCLAAAVLLLAGTTGAEEPTADAAPGLGAIPSRSFGIAEANGLHAIGPGFKTRFQAGGVEFTPALGSRVETNQPLGLEFESLRRGEGELACGGTALPRRADPFVIYDRGPVQERYEPRQEGVELSFVIPSYPEGSGPLVARLDLRTALPYRGTSPDGSLCFEIDGVGGVHIGGVTGIDATGREVAGGLQYDGETLELSLPADFVDSAVYPIVLDPLIGTTTVVSPSGQDVADPDVAYDISTDHYFVAWDRQYSNYDSEVYGALVNSDGTVAVPLIVIANDPDATQINPSVGNCNYSDRFLCAYQQMPLGNTTWDIAVTAIAAADGYVNLSAPPVISTETTDQVDPDVAGEQTTIDDDVMVVWTSTGTGIRGRQVTVPSGTGNPYVVGSELLLSTYSTDGKPAISKGAAGTGGELLVVWQRYFTGSPGDHDLYGRVIDRNGNFLAPTGSTPYALLTTIGPDEEDPDCDGVNGRWLVAYESQDVEDDGDNDILCMRVDLSGTALDLSYAGTMIEGDVNDDEQDPAVGYTGESVVVVWLDEAALDFNLGIRAVDPRNCQSCEGEEIAASTSNDEIRVEIATQFSGGGAGSQAMFVWESTVMSGGAGQIRAHRYDAVGCPPGIGYCFGDGSGTACPCGNNNDGSVYGSGCANGAFASGARLTGSGEASLMADTLVLSATGLDPNNSGLYFQANNDLSPGVAWGDGLQCAGGSLKRLGVRFSTATGTSTTAGWTTSISARAGNINAGDTKRYQLWYRDNSGGQPCGVGVNDFNATNGYEVLWTL